MDVEGPEQVQGSHRCGIPKVGLLGWPPERRAEGVGGAPWERTSKTGKGSELRFIRTGTLTEGFKGEGRYGLVCVF